jgi:hypothetical protein
MVSHRFRCAFNGHTLIATLEVTPNGSYTYDVRSVRKPLSPFERPLIIRCGDVLQFKAGRTTHHVHVLAFLPRLYYGRCIASGKIVTQDVRIDVAEKRARRYANAPQQPPQQQLPLTQAQRNDLMQFIRPT